MAGSLTLVAPSSPEDEDAIFRLAAELVLAIKLSIPRDAIVPLKLWPRIKAAMVTSATRATTFRQLASIMMKKLQVPAPHRRTSRWIYSIGKALGDEEIWGAFRMALERDAVFVVAEAQILGEGALAEERIAELEAIAAMKADSFMARYDRHEPYAPPDDASFEARVIKAEEHIRFTAVHMGRLLGRIKDAEANNAVLVAEVKSLKAAVADKAKEANP